MLWHFLGKEENGFQMSLLSSSHVPVGGAGMERREVSIFMRKARGTPPRFHHWAWLFKRGWQGWCLLGYITAIRAWRGRERVQPPYFTDEDTDLGRPKTSTRSQGKATVEPATPIPGQCFPAYSIPYNCLNNWTHIYSCVVDALGKWSPTWIYVINAWEALQKHHYTQA